MFKSLNRTYLVLALLLIGNLSAVFAVDLSQAFSQSVEKISPIASLFQGKAQVSNLYSKALKLVKDTETTSIKSAFDGLLDRYATCKGIKQQDIINILYYSNQQFRITFLQLIPKRVSFPTVQDVEESYQKFAVCKWYTDTLSDKQMASLNAELTQHFSDIYLNTYTISSLTYDNFWSDLFWNGTLDDSDFDLLYDINQVGKLLFDEFKESPEILFYRLPEVSSVDTWWGDLDILDDQSSYQVGAGGWSYAQTSGIPSSLQINTDSSDIGAGDDEYFSSVWRQNISSFEDKEIEHFIQQTNTPDEANLLSFSSALVFGNQCLDDQLSGWVIYLEEKPELVDAEVYMKAINRFIATPNIDALVNQWLLDDFYEDVLTPPGGNSFDSGYASMVANSYAEQTFGQAAEGTCEYACNNLPLDKQAQCELDCATSCIQSCTTYTNMQEKALCISDCTCFLISWPHGKGWEKVEDMFRIKFCKVPVQDVSINRGGKKVFSIQAIFQEIHDVLKWLKDSGQMVKFSKTKEFLDGNISINFADNFAFKLQVGFKPVFEQQSDTVKKKTQEQILEDFNQSIINLNTTNPEADDYNKYVVIADPAITEAYMEYAWSLSDINANIETSTTAYAAATTSIATTLFASLEKQYANDTTLVFVDTMIDFLKNNQQFRNNLMEVFVDMSAMSLELKTRINDSK